MASPPKTPEEELLPVNENETSSPGQSTRLRSSPATPPIAADPTAALAKPPPKKAERIPSAVKAKAPSSWPAKLVLVCLVFGVGFYLGTLWKEHSERVFLKAQSPAQNRKPASNIPPVWRPDPRPGKRSK